MGEGERDNRELETKKREGVRKSAEERGKEERRSQTRQEMGECEGRRVGKGLRWTICPSLHCTLKSRLHITYNIGRVK